MRAEPPDGGGPRGAPPGGPRLVAWEALCARGAPALVALERLCGERGLGERDRAFARRLVGSEARRRGTLRAILAHLAERAPPEELAVHLRLGLAQIFLLDRVADHAAVGETVAAVKHTHGAPQARFPTAVRRRALALRVAGPTGDPRRDLVGRPIGLAEPVFPEPERGRIPWAATALSMPARLLERWRERIGEERALAIARAALDEPPLSLRAPGVPGEAGGGERRAAARTELAAVGIATELGAHPAILIADAEHAAALIASAPFRAGRVTVQGQTALEAAELVGARPGERVLDLCAAPGGKTAVLAEAGASVVACDVDAEKLARAAQTLERLGQTGRAELVRLGAGGELPDEIAAGGFDAVLADAPCTNTGVLAARPEARWRFSRASQAALVAAQRELLARAARLVRPGGRIVWSVCSVEREEGAALVRAFLAARPGFVLQAELERWPMGAAPGPLDGGYAARIARAD